MANNASALKRNRQNEKKRIFNRTFRNRARTLIKKARAAITSNKLNDQKAEVQTEALKLAESTTLTAIRDLDTAASRGVLHKKNAARRKSRLMKQLAALKAQK